ncbi:MAG: SDR family oxidoreductase [Streptosporangiales bacterium]|nr:SDR family oxidoreductase [Streptosporangiales bacterium]
MHTTDSFDLTGETALVTGAARGIGRAIARELVFRGADALLVDLREPAEVVDELGSEFPDRRVLGAAVDVRSPEAVGAAVERAADDLGTLTILVNNAGTASRSSLEAMTLDEWTLDIDTNLRGCFLLCQAVLTSPKTQESMRSVVNISSISGIMGGPRSGGAGGGRSGPAYAASKGGVIALTKWLAKEVGDRGITVNSVAPGPVATAMTGSVTYSLDDQLIKRMGTPEEIAAAVAYLASPGARYVTGQVIRVCGGASVG